MMMEMIAPDCGAGERFIVGLRFQRAGKIYHFDADTCRDLRVGDFAVVETSRGRQIGMVIQTIENAGQQNGSQPLKSVLRKATAQDLVISQTWQCKAAEAVTTCQQKVKELKLTDVKIISAEFSFDGSRLSFLYSSEEGEKVDLRALRRVMQRIYHQSRVEMHLIGPRDVAKLLGGMGACGLETRCCAKFLTDFSPISIKMAKEQDISLTPTEITGMCGRLRCCLVYEYEHYLEMRKELPKRGKRVSTLMGDGKVVEVFLLRQAVMVELDKGTRHEFRVEELLSPEEAELARQKAEALRESFGGITRVVAERPAEKVSHQPAQQPKQGESTKRTDRSRSKGKRHGRRGKPPRT